MVIRLVEKDDRSLLKKIKPSLKEIQISKRVKIQEEGGGEFLILEDKNNPIGFVFLKWDGKKTHPEYPDMEDLYVRKEFRGKRYGTVLIQECEKRAKENGFSIIGLAVNPQKNSKAKKLYEKLGYNHDGRKSYVDGVYDGVEDWVIDLEKNI